MQRRQFIQAVGALVAGATARMHRGLDEAKLTAAAGIIERSADQGHIAAASLLVRQKEMIFKRAFGEARTADPLFLIASITKPLTAAGIMVLAEKGELALSDPVHKFVPEFVEGDRKFITIHHLLTHTSGLPDMLPENVELRRRHAPLEEFVERVIKTPLLFRPGSQVKYQSMGFLLAAEVAERITGLPFRQFLDDELFSPLEMKRTALGVGSFQLAETARCQVASAPGLYGGGSAGNESWDWNSTYWRNLGAPWGGAHSTTVDLAKFFQNFLHPGGSVLGEKTVASVVTHQTRGLNELWGLGFSLDAASFGRNCSPSTFGHLGSTGTIAWADPQKDLICVLLTTLPLKVSRQTVLEPVCHLVSESAI